MYMSRVKLDISKRSTQKALHSPQMFHGALESSYEGERTRNLWRLDQRGDGYDMLIVSRDRLDLSPLAEQFGKCGEDAWKVLDYQPFLDRLQEGSRWQFRLCANPIIAVKTDGSRGVVHAHVSERHQLEWLMKRADKHGFRLKEDEVKVIFDRWLIFQKHGARDSVRIRQVTYSGILEVCDAELFRQVLCNGMGKGKAYGCGLLTIASIP